MKQKDLAYGVEKCYQLTTMEHPDVVLEDNYFQTVAHRVSRLTIFSVWCDNPKADVLTYLKLVVTDINAETKDIKVKVLERVDLISLKKKKTISGK